MYIYDFEYDGQLLSDLGYIVCSFDSNGGIDNTRAGSEVTFNTVPTHSGKRYISTGTKYDKCLSTTLQICKDPEKFDVNERRITDEEFRSLSRWLNRREYKWYRNNIASLYNKTATASGAVASFNDGADDIPVKSLLVNIEPVQDLHGYANPWPAGGGKNLFNQSDSNYLAINASSYGSNDTKALAQINKLGAGTYTLSFKVKLIDFAGETPSTIRTGLYLRAENGGVQFNVNGQIDTNSPTIDQVLSKSVTFTLTSDYVGKFAYFYVYTGKSDSSYYTSIIYDIQIESGSTATDYIPYSNICPITGWTGATVTKTGKNLVESIFSDGKVPSVSTGELVNAGNACRSDFIRVSGGSATFSCKNATGRTIYCFLYDVNKNFLTYTNSSGNSVTANHADARYAMIRCDSGTTAPDDAQLELGSTASPYEPYSADTYAISFPSEAATVYGGTLDVTNGVLAVTHSINILDGNANIQANGKAATSKFIYTPYPAKENGQTGFVSNRFVIRTGGAFGTMTGRTGTGKVEFCLPAEVAQTTAAGKAWFAENPTQLIYPLATPITYQLTPQEVKTLLAANNIWADTGDTFVEYRVNDECVRQSTIGYVPTWFNASFNLSRIEIGSECYGVELNMTTDSPFGYGDERTESLSFAAGSLTKTFTDENDEIGDTYPEMEITCRQSGKLTLTDDVTGCSFEVNNCVNGEVITLSGDTMIISTSVPTHDIANDFNYGFFHFGNTFHSSINTVTASIPCDIVMRYKPIIKDTL